jgi:adenylate cyclase
MSTAVLEAPDRTVDAGAQARRQSAAAPGFDELLNREVLHSERRRVLTLAAALTAILAAILFVLLIAPDFVSAMFRGQIPWRFPVFVFPPFIAYELIIAGALTYLDRRGRRYPTFGRYANALVETSFPTLAVYSLSHYLDPQVAFASWPALLYFLFIVLSTLRLDFSLSVFTGAVAAIGLFALAWYRLGLEWRPADVTHSIAFHAAHSAVLLVAGLFAGSVGRTLKKQFERALTAASARDRVTNLFGQHVSPQVVDRLLAMGAGEVSEMRRVCVMFVDIRGFTAAARDRSPAQVVARLEEAFAILVEIVDRRQGVVNKFLGDGFLAMFGAPIDDPQAAANAVAAAREMLEAIDGSNVAHDWPIRIGIGVHIGDTVTGTVGSPRRKEYTVIGDTVNLASRLESLNKDFGSQLLISDAAHLAAGESVGEAASLGPVAVRGYADPVTVWRLA